MANQRLYQFPNKAVPVPADIVYVGDSQSAFNEVNCTIASIIGAYPQLLAFGSLTFGNNGYFYTNGTGVYTVGTISTLGVSLLADTTTAAMQSTLGLGTAATQPTAFFLQSANNLSDVASAPTALTNIGAVPLAGGTMTGRLILVGSPISGNEAADKAYVDTVASGIVIVPACYAATTGNLTGYTYNNGAAGVGATLTAGSNGAFALDGTSPALNALILVKDQSTAAQNGIYTLSTVGNGGTPAVLTRSTSYDTSAQIQPGDLVAVNNGTVNAGTAWLQTATVTTVGTDPINFSPFAVISAGTGLTKSGNQISLANPVAVNLGGTGIATATAYGIIIAGTTPTGAFQVVAPGTAGQVLTSNGAAAPATMQSVPSSIPTGTMFNFQQGVYTTPVAFSPLPATWSDTLLTVTITPTSASNNVLVRATLNVYLDNNADYYMFRIMRNSTPIGIGTSTGLREPCTTFIYMNSASQPGAQAINMEWLDSPAASTATVYKIEGYAYSGSAIQINCTPGDTNSAAYPRSVSTISVCEIKV